MEKYDSKLRQHKRASVTWSIIAVLLMIALGFAVNECEGAKRAERVANGNRIKAEYKADSLQIVNGKVIDSFSRRSEWKNYRNTHDDKEISAKIKRDKVERLKPDVE